MLSVIHGATISIQVTVAVADHVFQTKSLKVNVKVSFQVKVYHVAFSPVSVSDQLSTVTTFPLVQVPEAGV